MEKKLIHTNWIDIKRFFSFKVSATKKNGWTVAEDSFRKACTNLAFFCFHWGRIEYDIVKELLSASGIETPEVKLDDSEEEDKNPPYIEDSSPASNSFEFEL